MTIEGLDAGLHVVQVLWPETRAAPVAEADEPKRSAVADAGAAVRYR
jgi:hypothetical protein